MARLRCMALGVAHPAHVPQLRENRAALRMHRVGHRPPAFHLGLRVQAGREQITARLLGHLRALGDDQAGARVLREYDFAGPPGRNRKTLKLGRLGKGSYRLALRAIDTSTGKATKPAVRSFTIR